MSFYFYTLFILLFATVTAFSEPEAELFHYEGKAYLRIIVPSGKKGDTPLSIRLKEAAFNFALDEMERRGSITPEIREQIQNTEAPNSKTSYVMIASVVELTSKTLSFGRIEGAIRGDEGKPRFVDRLNAIRKGVAPINTWELINSFLSERGIGSQSPVVMETKNFVVRSSDQASEKAISFGGFLLSSFIERVVPKNLDAMFIETDLGSLSEFYVRVIGGLKYHRIYNESKGDEVEVPESWRKAIGKDRRQMIDVLGANKQKHMAVLAADAKDIMGIKKRVDKDPIAELFRSTRFHRRVTEGELTRIAGGYVTSCFRSLSQMSVTQALKYNASKLRGKLHF